MPYKFYTLDVFTQQIFGGNQLAVFPQAEGLTGEQMQQIAKEFNYSETVFVSPSTEKGDIDETSFCKRKLRIFTPHSEIPFAGHPTVGTAYLLAAIGEISLQNTENRLFFEEGVGIVPVIVTARDNQPLSSYLIAAQLPEFRDESPAIADLAAMLSLEVTDLLTEIYTPQAVSCGLPFLFIPLANREALGRANLNLEIWKRIIAQNWASNLYLFTFDPELPNSDIRARMFAPGLGIAEDPATGSAATALGGYLAKYHGITEGKVNWVIEQGFEMGRPSMINLEVDFQASQIREIRVGGASVLVSEGYFQIEN